MELEKLATDYGIEVTVEEMKAILHYDWGCSIERYEGPTLCGRLNEIEGVSRVNYDGHFGPSVFLTLETNEDTPQKHEQIKTALQKHIKKCMSLKDAQNA